MGLIFDQAHDRTHLDVLSVQTSEDITFRSDLSPDDRLTVLSFSRAVWLAHERVVRQPGFDCPSASQFIASTFLSLRRGVRARPQTTRDRPVPRKAFYSLIASLPPNSVRVFTDGSSHNSLRAGAGFLTTCPRGDIISCNSVPLGPISSNVAELRALNLAIDHCLSRFAASPLPSLPNVVFFVDSTYTLNIAAGRWKAKANLDTITTLKSSVVRLRSLTTVSLFWVPSHSGIFESELVDFLAKEGADGISSSTIPDPSFLPY